MNTGPIDRRQLAASAELAGPCVFHMVYGEHWANAMIAYMAAHSLRRRLGDLRFSNFHMPEWGIVHASLAAAPGERTMTLEHRFRLDFRAIEREIRVSGVRRINSKCYSQRLEYFPEAEFCRGLFQAGPHVGAAFGAGYVVCPIRGGETLRVVNGDYVQIPIGFYEEMIAQTGLRPVFMGQLAQNVYTDALRARFASAVFLPSISPMEDFQTIRRSQNIILSVSTFSWLAAWLSEARQIIMPLAGLFNPERCPDHDFIPYSEPRYRFFRFPNYAPAQPAELMASLAAVEGRWSEVGPSPRTLEGIAPAGETISQP